MGPGLLLIIMSYIIFCEENIYNRVSFDRMATVIRSQRIIGDVILYLLCSSLILFLLCVDVVPCRRLAAAQWWTGWIARPRLALLTTRQEDLDVVDLSRLFVGSLRLHYRLITWCQGFAACFLLPFFFFLNVRRTSEQIKIEMNDVMIVEIEFEFDNRHKKPLR